MIMDTTNQSNQGVKRIDLNTGVFMANGKEYTVEQFLSVERYVEFQILEKELAFGVTFKAMFDMLDKLESQLNKINFANAAVTLSDIKRGLVKVQEREPVILKICALFMNTKDENRAIITQDMIDTKISDWKAEGLAMNDFFQVALTTVSGFLGIYQRVTQTITGTINGK